MADGRPAGVGGWGLVLPPSAFVNDMFVSEKDLAQRQFSWATTGATKEGTLPDHPHGSFLF